MKPCSLSPFEWIVLLAMAFVAGFLALASAEETYIRPDLPPLVHCLTTEQIDKVVDDAPVAAAVTVPASYAKQLPERRRVGTNSLARAALDRLQPVIEDSRRNIPELKGLSDVDVAILYLLQMRKTEAELRPYVPTNTLEYYIGAGMRLDLLTGGVSNPVPVSVRE